MLISLAEHLKPIRALTRPHKGVVVDNVDPKKLGRVKVQIKGLLEVEKEMLPWCSTLNDPSNFDVPEIGAELYVIFPYGSIYFPFSLGYFNSETNINANLTGDDDNYPNTSGFSKQGFTIKYNKTAQEANLIHPSGSTAKLNKEGSFEMNLTKDLLLTIAGKVEQTVTGDVIFNTDGKLEYSAVGDVNVSSDGNVTIKANGQAIFEGTSTTIVGSSASATLVEGQTVALAGGGKPVATLGSKSIGTGNAGAPVISTVIQGSTKVSSA
jgi:hypothetical protein